MCHAVAQQLGGRNVHRVVTLAQRQIAFVKECFKRVAELDFVVQAQFDVDALNAVGVFGHARQRNHHVFVDLEGIGVFANRCRAFAV